jgi:alpha-1,2-mannosyltransferase
MKTLSCLGKQTRSLNRLLLAFVLGNVLLVPLGQHVLLKTRWADTTLAGSGELLPGGVQATDSWGPMMGALDYSRLPGRGRLYRFLFFENHLKFQYPPTSLLFLYPLMKGPPLAWLLQEHRPWLSLLQGTSWVLVALTAACTARIYLRTLRASCSADTSRSDRALAAALCVVLALTFDPLVRGYLLGQIQVWLDAAFALLFCCWLDGRRRLAGVLAAFLCLIKPQYGVLLLWGLLRRQWGFVAAAALTGAAGLAVSVSLFGVADHLDYLRVLSYISRHGESYHANQSVNGLLHRLLGNGNNLDWEPSAFPPFHPVVYLGTLASSLVVLALAFRQPPGDRERGSATDLALTALAATIASPVAWEHHYGILLPLYAFLLPQLVRRRVAVGACGRPRDGDRLGWATLPLLALSYLLVSNLFAATDRLAHTPFNFVQSYHLAGALLALFLLYRLRAADGEEALTEYGMANATASGACWGSGRFNHGSHG